MHELQPGSRLVRFYNPIYGPWNGRRAYGPLPGMRFDHHLPPPGLHSDRSVWYAATSLIGAVSEAFGDAGFLDPRSGRRICVASPRLSLMVLNLVGVAARAFGLDQRIGTELDSSLCQEWARAFYDHYPEIQGIRWRGRQAGSICVALNERAELDLLELALDYDILHPDVWPRITDSARRAHLRLTPLK
ncbi:MAG TPA: RES family NAD+ phosphorylase [Thermoanaerobaculia bacterium]|nr:RES family NAD+ phosphorylase [Thermoanaerobaculia bacterium]